MSNKNFRRNLLTVGLVLAAATIAPTIYFDLNGDQSATLEAAEEAKAPAAIPVSVAVVPAKAITQWSEFSGRLEAVDKVEIRSRVAGAIEQIHFQQGAIVQAGDLLVTIDPAPFEAVVAGARATVNAAEARASLAVTELARSKKLVSSNAVSQSDYDQKTNASASAEADVAAAKAALQTAELDLGYTQIRAPITGRVGKLEITVGNLIAAGSASPVLTQLVSQSPIYASFEANEELVSNILAELPTSSDARDFLGDVPVRMAAAGKTGIEGKLQLIDNSVDPLSGTVRVRAIFDNKNGALMPGQFARLSMGQAKEQNAVLVDEKAIGTDQNKKYVIVVKPDNVTEYREITVGAKADGLRVVTSGLKADERIVVNGLQRIRPGATVAPQMVSMAEGISTQQQASLAKPAL